MTTQFKSYKPEEDFLRVRDFLSETYHRYKRPLNWRIERWNYARYFAAPMLGAYQKEQPTDEDGLKGIHDWENTIGIWENERGEIAGVVSAEHPWPGEAFIQRHPGHEDLLEEMLDYAEETLIDKEKRTHSLDVYDDDKTLQDLLRERGYEKQTQFTGYDSVYTIGKLPGLNLPDGYKLQSMADGNDIEERREVFGRAFNHTDPKEWPSAFAYRELQKAPDYRKEQDLYIIAPNGKYVACCIVWYDTRNQLGVLEPVGTHPDYRRKGLGREVVLEAIRRVAALGAQEVQVGSGQDFYHAIGFERKYPIHTWLKEFQH